MKLIKLKEGNISKGFGILVKHGTLSYTKERGTFLASDEGVVILRKKKIPFQIVKSDTHEKQNG